MKLKLTLLMVTLAGLLSQPATALVDPLKPLDVNKQADVGGKNVNFDDVRFDTISQGTRELPQSPLSKGDLKLKNADVRDKHADFKMLEMSTIPKPVLPKANFTAKRAAVDKVNDEAQKQAAQTKQVAPITSRQIRAFTPAGEEELKNQLKDPH
jgi:hypothetical protein